MKGMRRKEKEIRDPAERAAILSRVKYVTESAVAGVNIGRIDITFMSGKRSEKVEP